MAENSNENAIDDQAKARVIVQGERVLDADSPPKVPRVCWSQGWDVGLREERGQIRLAIRERDRPRPRSTVQP